MNAETKKDVEEFVTTELKGLVDGTESDIQEFGKAIVADLIAVKATGNVNAEREVRNQARALRGASRLRISDANWRSIDFGIGLAAKLLAAAIGVLLVLTVGCKHLTAPGMLMTEDVRGLVVEDVVPRHNALAIADVAAVAQGYELSKLVSESVQVSRAKFKELAEPVLDRHDALVVTPDPVELARWLRSTAILRRYYP